MPSKTSHRFGENLKRIRKDKGLTQEALAKRCGIRQDTISRYENFELANPEIETVAKFARALKIDLLEFFLS